MRLSLTGSALTVEVADDGVGPSGAGGGHGLKGMAERAAALGGTVQTGPGDGGFLVHATLPLGGGR